MEKKPDETGTTNQAQKSDKSPQELMQQVTQADDSLNAGAKKSAVDELASVSTASPAADAPKKSGPSLFKKIIGAFNIYLIIYIVLVVISVGVFAYSYIRNQNEVSPQLETTELTEEALEELKTSDISVGDPRQILTIESHAVISGKVVLRDTLDVAGGLNIGGAINAPSIQSAGEGNFGSLRTNDLQAAGNAAIGGLLDVTGTLSVGQDLTVAGKIKGTGGLDITGSTTINGDLIINGSFTAQNLTFGTITFSKIDSSGPPPSVTAGGAAGGAATASISGTDMAGTVTINTGGGTGTGTLATINFTSAYSSNSPHIVLTPNGPGCAAIEYYVTNVSATQFAIGTTSTAPAAVTCRFNYIVIN